MYNFIVEKHWKSSSCCSEIHNTWWLVTGCRWNWIIVFNEINQAQSHSPFLNPVSHQCPGSGLWRPGVEPMLSVLFSEGREEMETIHTVLYSGFIVPLIRGTISLFSLCVHTPEPSPESVWGLSHAVNRSRSAHLRHCMLTQMRNVETQGGTRNPANFWGPVGGGSDPIGTSIPQNFPKWATTSSHTEVFCWKWIRFPCSRLCSSISSSQIWVWTYGHYMPWFHIVMVEVKIPVPSSSIRESSVNERCLIDSIPSEWIQLSFWLESLEIIMAGQSSIGRFQRIPFDPHAELHLGGRFCSLMATGLDFPHP
jgi:hypothetical protein